MTDYENPKNWTRQYVNSHRSECLLYLREINLMVVTYIKSRCYYPASMGLEMILNGLEVLQKNRNINRVRSCMATYSCAIAELIALADPVAIENEIRDKGIQPKYQGKNMVRYLRDVAIACFEDAQDFATSGELRDYAASMAHALKEGVSAERIRRDYAPSFPQDIQNILLKLDDDFFVPEIKQCAPDRCLVLDKTRLIFTQKAVGKASPYTPASYGPVEMPTDASYKTSPRPKPGNDFDAWMVECGWDEDDLEWAYKRVKFRRNIYGILCIFPPLGVMLLPFWLRAVYMTKSMRYRNMDVGFNIFTKIVAFLYGIPTFFIYPIIMGQVIKWTNWGMGLRDRKALIPTFAVLALIVFLLIRSNGIPFPDFSGLANFFNRTYVSDMEQTEPPMEPPTEETPDDLDDVQSYQNSGFIFPNSDTELIVQQEVENLSDSDLTYAINEIYARHGYLFRSDELRGYYEQFSWYTGRISPDEFSVDLFNRIEQQNWNMLVNERNRRTSSD